MMGELERVGRYEVIAPLEVGGMARIDLARMRGPYDFTRDVVIKRPLPHQATDPVALEQFRLEARLLATMHHPNVISFLEAGRDEAAGDFLAIEYVRGTSLRAVVRPRGPRLERRPSLAAALTIAVDVAHGLDYAHDRTGPDGVSLGIVHRDVSPSNVLLGFDGSVKLIDFGVAKLTEGATASGTLRGKITYMAPEQCKGEPIDRRADIYSIGVMLYELVTGQRPFYAADDIASLHKVVTGDMPDPRTVDPEIDPELAALIVRTMAYDREQRPATARALAVELEAFAATHRLDLGGRAISDALASAGEIERMVRVPAAPVPSVEPAAPTASRRRRRPVLLGAGLAIAATSLVTYLGFAGPSSSTATVPPEPARSATPSAASSPTTPTPARIPTPAPPAMPSVPEPAKPAAPALQPPNGTMRPKITARSKVERVPTAAATGSDAPAAVVLETVVAPPVPKPDDRHETPVWNSKTFDPLPAKRPAEPPRR